MSDVCGCSWQRSKWHEKCSLAGTGTTIPCSRTRRRSTCMRCTRVISKGTSLCCLAGTSGCRRSPAFRTGRPFSNTPKEARTMSLCTGRSRLRRLQPSRRRYCCANFYFDKDNLISYRAPIQPLRNKIMIL